METVRRNVSGVAGERSRQRTAVRSAPAGGFGTYAAADRTHAVRPGRTP